MRRGSAYLIGFLFKNSKLYLADEAPDMMSTLITLLSDTDKETVLVRTRHPALSCFSFLYFEAYLQWSTGCLGSIFKSCCLCSKGTASYTY
jgi:hypothetical protein